MLYNYFNLFSRIEKYKRRSELWRNIKTKAEKMKTTAAFLGLVAIGLVSLCVDAQPLEQMDFALRVRILN